MSVTIKMCHRRTKYPASETDECARNPKTETAVRQFRILVRNLSPECQSGVMSSGILVRNLRNHALAAGKGVGVRALSRKSIHGPECWLFHFMARSKRRWANGHG